MIGRPDLSVTRVAGPVSGVGATGQPLTVSADIKNEGPALANAGPFRVAFFLSATDAAPGAGTCSAARTSPRWRPARGSRCRPSSPCPRSLAADDYFLSVIADADQVIVESDEANNGLAVAPDAKITIRRPNLAVLSATLTPAPAGGGPTSVVPGQAFVVTARVQNTAEAPAAGRAVPGRRIPVAVRRRQQCHAAGLRHGRDAGALRHGVGSDLDQDRAALAGARLLLSLGDRRRRQPRGRARRERQRFRLTATALVQVKRADLTVTALSGPATGLAGKTVAVSSTVVNQGTAPATAVRVSFFVSPLEPRWAPAGSIGTRDIATLGATGSPTASSTASTTADAARQLWRPAAISSRRWWISAARWPRASRATTASPPLARSW